MGLGYRMLISSALLPSVGTNRLVEQSGIALGQGSIRSLEERRTAKRAIAGNLCAAAQVGGTAIPF
jgi:hypothetical protein